MGRQRRTADELLRPNAHEVLVYRVDGRYVLDSDRLRGADDQVVGATHVSVVDTSRNRPVRVEFSIPSSDADKFAVYVTFVCTVNDAVAVVRGGVEAQTVLWGYLRSHNKIFELGLPYSLSDVNEVRRVVNAQITAYTTIKPPTVLGMTVALASVEVGTPEFLANLEESRRDQHSQYLLAEQQQGYDQRRKFNQVRFDHVVALTEEEHEEVLAARRQRHEHAIATNQQQQDQFLAAEANEFARRELARNLELIGDSPRQALNAAYAAGQITATELAQQLEALAGREQSIAERLAERERETARQQMEWDRVERRELRAEAREDRLLTREDEQRRTQERRSDAWREKEWAREDKRGLLEVKIDLLKTAASQGHLDMVNLGLDRLYAEVVGDEGSAVEEGANASRPQLSHQVESRTDEADELDQKARVYEEDD
jgi:hypothetical protein